MVLAKCIAKGKARTFWLRLHPECDRPLAELVGSKAAAEIEGDDVNLGTIFQ